MPRRCFTFRSLLRDSVLLLVGTVLGILVSRAAFDVSAYNNAYPSISVQKRYPLEQDKNRSVSPAPCNATGGASTTMTQRRDRDMVQKQETSQNTPQSAKNGVRRVSVGTVAAGSAESTSRQIHGVHSDAEVYTKLNGRAKHTTAALVGPSVQMERPATRPKTLTEELGPAMRQTLLVGVVTSKRTLHTRALAINSTWGSRAPKLIFFSSEGTVGDKLPVVGLPGVDDTYPPQRKVYRMLKYMFDHHIDDFNWFLRADDDLYVRVNPLVKFLSSLDPSVDVYMGQPGLGKPKDLERIKLYPDEHYCMGGPGVILSRSLLSKLGPHLEECLENVVSWNEDLEVGRCIMRRLKVHCTWNYEVRYSIHMAISFSLQSCSINHVLP